MKQVLNFVRDNYVRIAATAALLFLCSWWGVTDLGCIPGAVAIILWVR